MAIISDLLRAALTRIGVVPIGEVIPGAHATLALNEFNSLLQEWSVEGMLVPAFTTQSMNTVNGTASYTWGTSGNISTRRPVELVSGRLTVSTGVYESLTVYPNLLRYTEYTSLPPGRPYEVYYDPTYPLATMTFYPTPDAIYAVSLTAVVSPIPYVIGDTLLLGPEYESALSLELATRLMVTFGKDIPTLVVQAKMAKAGLITNNSKRYLQLARFDSAILSRGEGNLNSVLTGV